MSSIGFLTRDGEARVSGREHAKFTCLLLDLSWHAISTVFDVTETNGPCLLRRAFPLPSWVTERTGSSFAAMARLDMGGDSERHVRLPDTDTAATLLDVKLNTVVAAHSDPVALAVRLAAQCEVNAWIDGADRAWLADLIDAGRTTRYPPEVADSPHLTGNPLFADEPSINGHYDGWPGVVDFLRSGTSTVVLDSSFTDGFPDLSHAAWPGPPGARWRRLWRTTYTPTRQWDTSEAGLRRRTRQQCSLLQISPDNLHQRNYGIIYAPTWADVAAAWQRTPSPA